MPIATQHLAVGELTFDAIEAGPATGPGVLFLHGFPESMHMWVPLFPELVERGYHCVAVNQRGYSSGARPLGAEHYDTTTLAGDVVGILDALGWEQAHLVGHDWGAAVAWRVAALTPDRLRTLNVLSVGHPGVTSELIRTDADQQRRSRYITRFREPDSQVALLADDAAGLRAMFAGWRDQAAVEHNVRLLSEPGALEAALHWYRAAGRGGQHDGQINLPVLYIWSDRDVALGREAAERTGDFVSGPYRFVVLEGISHWIVQEAPDQVTAELLDHLALHP